MKKYWSLFRIRFVNGLQYRAAALAGIATQFAWGFLLLLLFRAFYRSSPEDFPMEFSQLVNYIWLQQAFLVLFSTWMYDNEIFACILNGNVAYELTRPMKLYPMWFCRNLSMRVSRAVLRCIPVLTIAFFLPKPWRLSPPADLLHFFLFALSLILSLCVVIGFCMLVYIATFYTLSPQGLRLFLVSITELFSGALIPLPFFPDSWQAVLSVLPFAAMQNVPLRLYSANLTGLQAAQSLALQLVWLAVLLLAGEFWMRHAVHRVVVQGG